MHTKPSKRLAVFKTKVFSRFARKARIADSVLWEAAIRADQGLMDADLGGGVVKLRLARGGEGKSGGSRAIVLFRFKDRAVFVYGFEKKDRGNISREELAAFRELAEVVLGYSDAEIAQRVADGALIRVKAPAEAGHGEEISQ